MRQPWTAASLVPMRRLAVETVLNGDPLGEVAESCGVSPRTLQRWVRAWKQHGEPGLANQPRPGRPRKLDEVQTQQILAWLDRSPSEFGFVTERWTASRLVLLIEQRFGIHMNFRYLSDWLRRHGVTPQMPEQQARERDEPLIRAWLQHQWPRIKKRPAT